MLIPREERAEQIHRWLNVALDRVMDDMRLRGWTFERHEIGLVFEDDEIRVKVNRGQHTST
jgi:hypothetical protein